MLSKKSKIFVLVGMLALLVVTGYLNIYLNNRADTKQPVSAESSVNLLITKGLCPEKVNENGKITYTFIIENTGSTQALASDNVVLSDTFLPVLKNLTAAYNGTLMGEGNYTYNDATGEFATTAGFITVPAVTYTQNEDGSFTITPGTAKITVTGTI